MSAPPPTCTPPTVTGLVTLRLFIDGVSTAPRLRVYPHLENKTVRVRLPTSSKKFSYPPRKLWPWTKRIMSLALIRTMRPRSTTKPMR